MLFIILVIYPCSNTPYESWYLHFLKVLMAFLHLQASAEYYEKTFTK